MNDLLYNIVKGLGNLLLPVGQGKKDNSSQSRGIAGDYLSSKIYQQPTPTSTPIPTATPRPTAIPTSTPTPTRQVLASSTSQEYNQGAPFQKIPYQTDKATTQYVPGNIAQILMKVFDPIGAATESASVLAHPYSKTLLDWEVPGSSTRSAGGENRGFKTGREVDIPNDNGSIDRGLFRINSDTFAGWMSNPNSKSRLAQYGITNYDDMLDPYKNAMFARLLMESTPTQNEGDRSWRKWWAAPLELRHPSLKKK